MLPAGARGRAFHALGAEDQDQKRKAEYYPDIDKRDLFKLGYIAARSGHSRGSTVDLTLVRRADNAELDMGTVYDFSGRQSWVADKSVSVEAQRTARCSPRR